MRYIVFHSIRAGQKTHRTAKLVITDIPEKTSANAVQSVLEQAGKASEFSEAGVPWGNHEIKSAASTPKDATGADEAPSVTWESLQNTREIRRVTLRLTPQHYSHIAQTAKRSNQSMQQWCVNTLLTAANKEKSSP